MRLVTSVLATLVLAAPASAAEPVSWDDPCGDAAGSVTVMDQRQALPPREGLDLRSVTLTAAPDVVRIELRTCGPVDSGFGTALSFLATDADGCVLSLVRQDQVDLTDPTAPEAGPVATFSRNCEGGGVIDEMDASEELAAGAMAVSGDRLTFDVPRGALGGAFAPGVRLTSLGAGAVETGAFIGGLQAGQTTVLSGYTGTRDGAPGPAELTLGP